MKVYINWKGPQGRETVDEFEQEPGQARREFMQHVWKMMLEYQMAGMAVYSSSRPCANWRD